MEEIPTRLTSQGKTEINSLNFALRKSPITSRLKEDIQVDKLEIETNFRDSQIKPIAIIDVLYTNLPQIRISEVD